MVLPFALLFIALYELLRWLFVSARFKSLEAEHEHESQRIDALESALADQNKDKTNAK